MDNLWDDNRAAEFAADDLAMRVYSSRLLGREADLVLHGGGNTSVKSTADDVFGKRRDVLFVKGSGWDLKTIEAPGYAPCDLDYLRRLAALESLSDSDMMRQLRLSLLDPAAPTPSVEAILHAIIPHKFVDHTHTDAVVAISNTPEGDTLARRILGEKVLVLPYIMPGFVLARQVHEATRTLDWSRLEGIFLMHHGLFTFADDARTSYERMIALVNGAEDYLREQGCWNNGATGQYTPKPADLSTLAALRKGVSELAGRPMLARWQLDGAAVGFSNLANVNDIATRGPITPDHGIHTKIHPLILDGKPDTALQAFRDGYLAYFNAHNDGSLNCLDPAPRFGIWRGRGMLSFGPNVKRLQVVGDISRHTIKAIQWGEALGGWQALPARDLFEVEYWELEQAKLKKSAASSPFEGKVAVVSGAASGIGQACVEELLSAGACVAALDIKPEVSEMWGDDRVLGLQCDVTDSEAVTQSLAACVSRFGGIDVLVSNAGSFSPSEALGDISDNNWRDSLELNLTSHMRLLRETLPFLKLGLAPSVVIIASKNVPAPGPGAAAYSAAKAALTQMARVAALELGSDGIRVNVLHPNAVFDTGVWDAQTLEKRAAHYGLSIEAYKQNNVLGVEVTSRDVAVTVRLLAGSEFSKTTGAQIPVDGGNDRVI